MTTTDDAVTTAGDNRPPVYREGDVWVMRASSFGGCTTKLVRTAAGMTGEPYPKTLTDAFQFGHDAELPIIRKLEAETPWRMLKPGEMRKWGTVDRSGQLALEMKGPGFVIRCHPDGIVRNQDTGELRVLEVKTRAEASSDVETDEGYRWQFSIEHAVTKLPVLLVVGLKVPGQDEDGNTTKIRVLKDGPLDVRELAKVPYRAGQVKARGIMLRRLFDEAAEQGRWDGECDRADWFCPFNVLCGHGKDAGKEKALPVPEGKMKGVSELAAVFHNAKAEMDEAKAGMKDAKAEYDRARKALAEVLGDGRWEGGGWTIGVKKEVVKEKVVREHTRTTVTVEGPF